MPSNRLPYATRNIKHYFRRRVVSKLSQNCLKIIVWLALNNKCPGLAQPLGLWYNRAMHRFLVPAVVLDQKVAVLPGDASRHLKVVRPRSGEEVELFDGKGSARTYRVDLASGAPVLSAAGAVRRLPPMPFDLALFACVTKGSRWDWTIEKAVELGVSRIVPVISARCIVRLPTAERAAKAERWRRIAADAARQSDAVWLPEVDEAVDFPDALAKIRNFGRVFAGALTDPVSPPLWKVLSEAVAGGQAGRSRLGIFVGPEGDFTPDELQAVLQVATPVSFGPTILRAETAAIFGISVLAAAGASFVADRTSG